MRLVAVFCLAGLLLGCESRPMATTKDASSPTRPVAASVDAAPRASSDTIDVSSLPYTDGEFRAITKTDTLIQLAGRRYRLLLQAQADSARQLRMDPEHSTEASSPAADTSAGPTLFADVHYSITLLDSTGHRIFRRLFTKPSFYRPLSKELVLESLPQAAEFLGYNSLRKQLLFRQEFMIEDSDVGGELFLALDLHGNVQQMNYSNEYGGGGSDCAIQQARSGQAVITCSDLLLANGRHQSLQREGKLVAARFLSDTTVLTVYDYVVTKRVKDGDSWSFSDEPIARLKSAPNAFVLSANTGRLLAQFQYRGYYEVLGYTVPRRYVWQTKCYYLLDDERHSLRVIPKHSPQLTTEISLRQLPRFKPPLRPHEVRFRIPTEYSDSAFYVDTVTHKIRYQSLQ